MDKTTRKQLAADLAIAQLALRNIAAMLDRRLHTDASPLEDNVHFNIGRACQMAKMGLIESGHTTRHALALNYVERSNQAQEAK